MVKFFRLKLVLQAFRGIVRRQKKENDNEIIAINWRTTKLQERAMTNLRTNRLEVKLYKNYLTQATIFNNNKLKMSFFRKWCSRYEIQKKENDIKILAQSHYGK